MNEIRIGRALQLEALKHARNKVTLGFKCDAGTKILLAQEAYQSGMTLSEYVDTVVSARSLENKKNDSVISNLKSEIEDLRTENNRIEQVLQKYEKETILEKLFEQNKGKSISFEDSDGRYYEIKIRTKFDIFKVIINSFKIN
jgi:hypothetical protein